MAKIVVLLADGFEEVEAVTPIDFLRRAGIEVTVLGVTGGDVTGSHGITIRSDEELSDFTGNFDAVLIPGGMPGAKNVSDSPSAIELIKKADRDGKLIAAICAAPAVVLSRHGLIRGRAATCYPGYEQKYRFSGFRSERVVIDGTLITSRGPGTAAEFAIAIVRHFCGDAAADGLENATLQPQP